MIDIWLEKHFIITSEICLKNKNVMMNKNSLIWIHPNINSDTKKKNKLLKIKMFAISVMSENLFIYI